MKRVPWYRRLLLASLFTLCAAASAAAQTTVVVVRHAEKVDDSSDPALSEAGTARALSLADVLMDAGVRAILTTQYQRTRMTAQPTAERTGVPVQIVEARGREHAKDVAARVRELADGGTILVVGHSNTVPAIIRELGGPAVSIADEEYHHLFVLTLAETGARLIRSRY